MQSQPPAAPFVPPLVEIRGGGCSFGRPGLFGRPVLHAVRDVTLAIRPGETVGLVGESGSGKSTLGRMMLGLQPATSGFVLHEGRDIAHLRGADLRRQRGRAQVVFQDPFSSLDPRRRVAEQIADGVRLHRPGADVAAEVARLMALVGLLPDHAQRFPHEFSGGQRQRIGIARAIASRPDFLVADEPVSALDVSVQAQIVGLLRSLRDELGLAILFIGHDLPVVRELCDRVVVLYLGRVMEEGPSDAVFHRPAHPYTRALLAATPLPDPARRTRSAPLAGDPPSPLNPPRGCPFHTRCAMAIPACAEALPPLAPVPGAPAGHHAACIRAGETLPAAP